MVEYCRVLKYCTSPDLDHRLPINLMRRSCMIHKVYSRCILDHRKSMIYKEIWETAAGLPMHHLNLHCTSTAPGFPPQLKFFFFSVLYAVIQGDVSHVSEARCQVPGVGCRVRANLLEDHDGVSSFTYRDDGRCCEKNLKDCQLTYMMHGSHTSSKRTLSHPTLLVEYGLLILVE